MWKPLKPFIFSLGIEEAQMFGTPARPQNGATTDWRAGRVA